MRYAVIEWDSGLTPTLIVAQTEYDLHRRLARTLGENRGVWEDGTLRSPPEPGEPDAAFEEWLDDFRDSNTEPWWTVYPPEEVAYVGEAKPAVRKERLTRAVAEAMVEAAMMVQEKNYGSHSAMRKAMEARAAEIVEELE